ncbi:toll/interleukin-1 receptor domain-containing protein [Magnetospira sp. QH-2]|uniref:toll/interleukin-1 receptor domain-containing protein n=1 Tax=Magnetospira sp. (strain QH-2) TaxID=1288970 RepID=UPI00208E217D|nr:toll/interleukin-1 receptor domain-containing protein [Magnetospira sp. QH-2]
MFQDEISQRDTIFISHATPGDNAFATWLASRLSMAGYQVWCDQEKLLGGEDFWQDIEDALRHRTVKFVLVVSQNAFDENQRIRDGIQKEIGLANILKKQISDDYFIVPMRIDDTSYSDFSIDFLRLPRFRPQVHHPGMLGTLWDRNMHTSAWTKDARFTVCMQTVNLNGPLGG